MRLPARPFLFSSVALLPWSLPVFTRGGGNMYGSEPGVVNGGCGEHGHVATLADIKRIMTLKSFRMPIDGSLIIYAYPEFDFKGRPIAFSKSIESLSGRS